MALSVSQIVASSYAAVLAEKRKAANQWAESAFMREMERQGAVVRKALGSQIEAPLDYRANPNGGFLATDLAPVSLTKTEVVTSAVYDIAEILYPVVWSKKDEVMNPSENQKIDLAGQRMSNGIDSHDDQIEQALFATSTNGFLGLGTHLSTAGTGSDGGIDSSVETFWRNQQATYVDDTDIVSAFTSVWNACAKGSGAMLQPTFMVSGATPHATFEGTQQGNQRYIDTQDAKVGFKTLAFKTARYVFSQYGGTNVYFLNPKNFMLCVSSDAFREKGDINELPNAAGYRFFIYSALQSVTNNRSRLGVAHL